MAAIRIRPIRRDECDLLGRITVDAYVELEPEVADDPYAEQLRDVAGRLATGALVLVAVDEADEVIGGVTYVDDPNSPLAEHNVKGAASIRMLAVAPAAQRRGIGGALATACVDRARADSRFEVVLHSTTFMLVAHRVYERLGFERAEDLDWEPYPGLLLLGFRLVLTQSPR